MGLNSYLTLEELATIFCMEKNEMQHFLLTRDLNFDPDLKNGLLIFPVEQIQKYLQSQYFI